MDSKYTEFIQKQGNSYYVNEGSVDEEESTFLYNFAVNNKIERILEIGFNGGLSSAAFLCAPGTHVTSFDIGFWPYVLSAKQLIDSEFPDRHTLIIGNSLSTVPRHFSHRTYDLAFIDGGHDYNTAYGDIQNCKRLVSENGYVIIDDYNYSSVQSAVMDHINQGTIRAIEVFEATDKIRCWFVAKYCT